MNRWVLEVQGDRDELFIELPDEVLDQVGWQIGDALVWDPQPDGSYTLRKKVEEEKIFVIETITVTKHVYAVKAKSEEHALDSVAMGDVIEFGQKYIDENIISCLEMKDEQEYFNVFDKYNSGVNYQECDKLNMVYKIDYKT